MSSTVAYGRDIIICPMNKIAYLLQALSLGISRNLSVFQVMMNTNIDSQKRRIPIGIVISSIQNIQIRDNTFCSMSWEIFPVKCMRKSMVWIRVSGRMRTRSLSKGFMRLLCITTLNNSWTACGGSYDWNDSHGENKC